MNWTKDVYDIELVKASDFAHNFSTPDNLFVAQIQPKYGEHPKETIMLDTTLPLELAECAASPESIVQWVKKYGITHSMHYAHPPLGFSTLKDGRSVVEAIAVSTFQRHRDDVFLAVKLWEAIARRDEDFLKQNIAFSNGEVTWVGSGFSELLNIEVKHTLGSGDIPQGFEVNNMLIAACIGLRSVVNGGLINFPPLRMIDFSLTKATKDGKTFRVHESKDRLNNVMSYIWDVIRLGIDNYGINKWPYRRCEDCGKWLDASLPGAKKFRCDACARRRNRELSKLSKRADRRSDG